MSYAISFVCRPCKANKKGFASVEMSIILNNERTILTLPRKEIPSEFKKAMESKRGNCIKDFCYAEMRKVQNTITEMENRNIPLNVLTLKEFIRNGWSTSYRVEDLFKEFLALQNKKTEVKDGDGGSTLKTYEKYVNVTKAFTEYYDGKKDVTTISNALIVGFKSYLATVKKYQDSTIHGYMSKLKSIIKFAMANGRLKQDPFFGIKINKKMKSVETITENEYKAIVNKRFEIERLEKVRKLLVIAGGCGLAYCDIMKLTKEDFFERDNKICITKKRGKTNVQFWVVLMPEAEAVVRSLDFDLSSLKMSNQKINSYAKEIQDLCGITSVDSLHYYLFRHFFARRLVNSGMPIEIVSKCLGHSTTALTSHYAKLLRDTTLDRVIASYAHTNII